VALKLLNRQKRGEMKFLFKIVTLVSIILISANAQILECRPINDTSLGVQFAKYKFKELKSANGTIYKKGAYNSKYDYTIFTAATRLGIERISLYNKSKFVDGIEMFEAIATTEFINGMIKEGELLCYDLIQMNKQRIKEGNKPSRITVTDY